jgi:hypothetical protein
VLGDSPEPRAPPDEVDALWPEDLDELFLAEAVHRMYGKQCCLNQTVKKYQHHIDEHSSYLLTPIHDVRGCDVISDGS